MAFGDEVNEHFSQASGASITIDLGTPGTTANNLLIAVEWVFGAQSATPTGWTQVHAQNLYQMFYRIADGTEGNTTFDATGNHAVTIVEFEGPFVAAALDQQASATSGGSNVTSLAVGSITPTVDESLVVAACGVRELISGEQSWTVVTETAANSLNAGGPASQDSFIGMGMVADAAKASHAPVMSWTTSDRARGGVANFERDVSGGVTVPALDEGMLRGGLQPLGGGVA